MADDTDPARPSNPNPESVDPALAGLEPVAVWRYFGDLARIPRASGNEAGVRAYIKRYAADRHVACEENEVGDLLLRFNPDAEGPVIGLQAHMDMVCVAEEGLDFDFARDPIPLMRDGDFVTARGTSLGADNGLGIAFALALAEEAKGPIEVLLTVDEEQGFTGIEGVEAGWLRASYLINLDSEEEGYLTIASAGARDFVVKIPAEREALKTEIETLAVTVQGLKGGHSGIEIHRGRTNALKVMGRVLEAVGEAGGVALGINGGRAPNVIPSSCTAVVGLPPGAVEAFRTRLSALNRELSTQEDPALRIEAKATADGRLPLTASALDRLVALLEQLPTGVLVPSHRDPTQPFVSNNMAVVKDLPEGSFELTMMSRSPSSDELEKLAERYAGVASRHGAVAVAGRLVPGWEPNERSALLALFQKKHRELYGKEAKVLEIHAGLECGALQSKYPDMDLISVGPDIFDVHSTDERVSVESTGRVFDLVRRVIREIQSGANP